jgi:DNA-binding transcriptional regulator/RsmH inhibitor MraZ
MNGEVVIAGMYDYLELWSADAWVAVKQDIEASNNTERWMDLGI